MPTTVQILTVILVAFAMSPALAHALELPSKKRLPKQEYFALQRVYYLGFTIGGGIGEVARIRFNRRPHIPNAAGIGPTLLLRL